MLKALNASEFLWTGQSLRARASLGVGMGSGDDSTWVTFLERADVACYEAKSKGGNAVRLFSGDSATSPLSAAAAGP